MIKQMNIYQICGVDYTPDDSLTLGEDKAARAFVARFQNELFGDEEYRPPLLIESEPLVAIGSFRLFLQERAKYSKLGNAVYFIKFSIYETKPDHNMRYNMRFKESKGGFWLDVKKETTSLGGASL